MIKYFSKSAEMDGCIYRYRCWHSISFTISYLISGALGAFLLLNYIRARRMLKRAGMKNMKEFFKSLSASSSPTYGGYSPIKYYCMSCGKEHKEIACPNCGSKMKRAR